jgi:hypothetical protein
MYVCTARPDYTSASVLNTARPDYTSASVLNTARSPASRHPAQYLQSPPFPLRFLPRAPSDRLRVFHSDQIISEFQCFEER